MKSMKFSCPDELRDWVEEQAEKERRSVSAIIRIALYQMRADEEATKQSKVPA